MKRPAQAPKRKAFKTRPQPKRKVAKEKVAKQKVGKQKVATQGPVLGDKVDQDQREKKRQNAGSKDRKKDKKAPVEGRLMTEAG